MGVTGFRKKMKKLIIFISTCCLLYSCHDSYHHAIPQDKIPLLKNNDIVYFQDSASNKIDTIQLDVRNIWHQDMEDNYWQYIEIYYNKFYLKNTLLCIYISPIYTSSDINFQIENYFTNRKFVYSKRMNLNIGGVTYSTVHIYHDYNNLYPDTIPNSVYYTFSNGIIRYEYKDGRVYNLVSK